MRAKQRSSSWLAAAGVAQAAISLAAADPGPAAWERGPEVAGIVATVPALKQPLPAGFLPTLFWWQAPLSYGNPAKLKEELQALTARGIMPNVDVCAEYETPPGSTNVQAAVAKAVAEARAVAEAGFPVHLVMKQAVLSLYRLPDGKVVRHADAPDADKKDAVGNVMPCLILTNGWTSRAERMREVLRQFADAKIPVAGVWYDYEDHPLPWNGIFEVNGACPSCRKAYPAGVLDDRERFVAWVFDWRAEALAAAFSRPVKALFPKALVGHYGYAVSSVEHPVADGNGLCEPPAGRNPAEIDVVQPALYANTPRVRRYFNADWPVTGPGLDAMYFGSMLRSVSKLHHNVQKHQVIMPWVCGFCDDARAGSVYAMTRSVYREFLRHVLLRGARGFCCFNVAPPYGPMTDYYTELADINVAYNSLFAHREFLEGGEVLNDEWIDPKDTQAVVWSGLRKGDKALVRIFTLSNRPRFADVIPFPGVAVRLLASPAGATYIVDRSGTAQVVE